MCVIVLCINFIIVLQVAVIKTYCIDVSLGMSSITFGNHDRISGCLEGLSVFVSLSSTPTLLSNSGKKFPEVIFRLALLLYSEKGRLELTEHCKLLVVGETGNTADGRCEDFEWEAC